MSEKSTQQGEFCLSGWRFLSGRMEMGNQTEHGSLAEVRRSRSEFGVAKATGIYREYWKEGT